MSTTTTPTPPGGAGLSADHSAPNFNRPKVSLVRHVRVELRKMVDTRAGMWLFIIMGLLTAGAMVLYYSFSAEESLTFPGFAQVAITPQAFILPVLGILLITSEWGQRTALNTFTLEPRRSLVITAKIIAAVIIGIVAVALLVGVAAAATAVADATHNVPGAWDFEWRFVGFVMLVQIIAIVWGLAFGILLLNSAAAIVLYFVLPIALNIVTTLVESLRDIAAWIDPTAAQMPLFTQSSVSGEQWAQIAVTSAIWIVLPLVIGWFRLTRAEIKTA